MAKPENLIDVLYKESFSSKTHMNWRSNVKMRHILEKAHRFVADVPMSHFMADLSTEAYHKHRSDKAMLVKVADSLRLQARLPHETIWIEYYLREYQRRSQFLRADTMSNPEETPVKEGWLIQQHPTLTTAHIMHIFTWSDIHDSKGNNLWTFPFAFAWCCDESKLPWPISIDYHLVPHTVQASEFMYGLPKYHRNNVDCVSSPLIEDPLKFPHGDKYYGYLMREWTGIMRRAWALLATIDHLPVSYAASRPSRGFLGGHQIRRYLDHKTITLRIPERKDTRVIARKAIAHAHRKRHEVRAHWRDDWRNPPSKTCNPHIWEMVGNDPDTIYCTLCNGRQFQIHRHERGDASLGYVYHDYELRH